jgi:hypothetical protein
MQQQRPRGRADLRQGQAQAPGTSGQREVSTARVPADKRSQALRTRHAIVAAP